MDGCDYVVQRNMAGSTFWTLRIWVGGKFTIECDGTLDSQHLAQIVSIASKLGAKPPEVTND